MPRLKPGAAGWEVRMLPLGYAATLEEELNEDNDVLIRFRWRLFENNFSFIVL